MQPDPEFSFDVTVSSHDALREGKTALRLKQSQFAHHRIVVAAPTLTEAHLVAAQMASLHGMCTGVHLRV